MTVALDKRVKFFNYQQNLNNSKYNPQRGVQYFDEGTIQNFCLPSKEVVNTQITQNSNM